MSKQLICVLHTSVGCSSRSSYESHCRLENHSIYATCKYQLEAVIPAAIQDESPENVVQQPLKAGAEATSEADVF